MVECKARDHVGAPGVAHQLHRRELQRMHDVREVIDMILVAVHQVCRLVGFAEARQVDRDHAKVLRQHRDQHAEAERAARAGPGAVHQHHRLALARLDIARLHAARHHPFRRSRALRCQGTRTRRMKPDFAQHNLFSSPSCGTATSFFLQQRNVVRERTKPLAHDRIGIAAR